MPMRTGFSLATSGVLLCFCGCPLGTPRDHYRPHGHADTTIAISPSDDAILFNAAGTGGRDLYILRLANLKVLRVASTPDYEVAASFSPNGQRIVYAAGVPGDRADHIFTVGTDGASKTQLTDIDANDTSPRFSPDGTMIVFARDKTYAWGGLAANWENGGVICVIGTDGTGERQLTPDDGFAFKPCFAPDGQSVIYFTSDGCFSVPIDGSGNPIKVGPVAVAANFSADGKKMVYSHGKYSPDHELFTANLDGTSKFQLTNSTNGCFHGIFSNRGGKVYFLMEEWPQGATGVPKSSIWEVHVNGTGQTQITDLSLFDDPLNWTPQNSP